MRIPLLSILMLLAAMPALPPAEADWGIHYGAHYRGCGPFGLVDAPRTSCPQPSHGGWLESANCEGETCALRVWHDAYAFSNEPRAMSMRSFLVLDLEETPLCAAEGEARVVRCATEGAVVRFPMSSGCSELTLRTLGWDQGQTILTGLSESFVLLCREGDALGIGPVSAFQWVGGGTWYCGEEILLAGCFVGAYGRFGVDGCTAASCEVVGWIEAGVVGFESSPRAIALEFTSPQGSAFACADADHSRYAICETSVRLGVALAPGECAAFALRARSVTAAPAGTDALEVPFVGCRAVDYEWVEFRNV